MLPFPKARAVRLGYRRASESPIDDGVRSLLRGTPEYLLVGAQNIIFSSCRCRRSHSQRLGD
jgi:hypothetical protein